MRSGGHLTPCPGHVTRRASSGASQEGAADMGLAAAAVTRWSCDHVPRTRGAGGSPATALLVTQAHPGAFAAAPPRAAATRPAPRRAAPPTSDTFEEHLGRPPHAQPPGRWAAPPASEQTCTRTETPEKTPKQRRRRRPLAGRAGRRTRPRASAPAPGHSPPACERTGPQISDLPDRTTRAGGRRPPGGSAWCGTRTRGRRGGRRAPAPARFDTHSFYPAPRRRAPIYRLTVPGWPGPPSTRLSRPAAHTLQHPANRAPPPRTRGGAVSARPRAGRGAARARGRAVAAAQDRAWDHPASIAVPHAFLI